MNKTLYIFSILLLFLFVVLSTIHLHNLFTQSKQVTQSEQESYMSEFESIAESGHKAKFISRDEIEKYYDLIGPEAMISILNRDPVCHSEAHNLGKVIYIRTQDIGKSLEMCSNSCTGGCYDGLFMGMFEDFVDDEDKASNSTNAGADLHISITDENRGEITDRLLGICSEETEIAQHYGQGACVHNLGHAVMYLSSYNISRAEDMCKIYDDPALIFYCSTGVYMERNITFNKQDEAKGSYYPCDQDVKTPSACYRYEMQDFAWDGTSFQGQNSAEVLQHCLSVTDTKQRLGCFYGYGFNFNRIVKGNARGLVEFCSNGNPEDRRMCIESAAGGISRYGLEFADLACSYVEESLQEICNKAARNGNFGLDKDFNELFDMDSQNE